MGESCKYSVIAAAGPTTSRRMSPRPALHTKLKKAADSYVVKRDKSICAQQSRLRTLESSLRITVQTRECISRWYTIGDGTMETKMMAAPTHSEGHRSAGSGNRVT